MIDYRIRGCGQSASVLGTHGFMFHFLFLDIFTLLWRADIRNSFYFNV